MTAVREHANAPNATAGARTEPPRDLPTRDLLERAVEDFVEAEHTLDAASPWAYWEVAQVTTRLLAAVARARSTGWGLDEVDEVIAPARAICASAPFIGHAQTWPRGYPGDFEIVEQIVTQEIQAPPGTFAAHLEHFMLSSPAAQQHRNKVAHQASLVEQALTQHDGSTITVLIIASGGAADLRRVAPQLVRPGDRFVLNDIDLEALTLAARLLGDLADRCVFVNGNVFKQIRELGALGPFDLVLAGGLFDYLDDPSATALIALALEHLVAPGGLLYFSNISADQPYGLMLEHLGGWHLIERDEAAVRALVTRADVDVTVRRDLTAITLLTEVRKRA